MKKIALFLLVLIGLSFVGLGVASAVQIDNPIGATNIKELIEKIANGVALVIGPLAGVMIVVAGILFVVSVGKPEGVQNAKTALLYAVIGGVIALAAKGLAEFLEKIFK